ncbi:MAG: hypothetical protein DMG48_02990 [Acidobacteria bacterium]|nr:MAG: hypothetical protein DMG48_02990 [Acidobacteriota bacterium]
MDMSDVLYRFYAAGYEGERYPIDLRRIGRREDRQAARKAHAEGIYFQRRDRIFVQRMCGRRQCSELK